MFFLLRGKKVDYKRMFNCNNINLFIFVLILLTMILDILYNIPFTRFFCMKLQ